MTFFNAVVIASLIFSVLTLLFRISHMYDTFSDSCVLIFEVVFCATVISLNSYLLLQRLQDRVDEMEETMTAACDKINSVLDKLDLLGVDGAPAIDVMDRTKRLEQVRSLTQFNSACYFGFSMCE